MALRGHPRTEPLRILVVDDDAAVRESIVDALDALGHQPVEAASPTVALRTLGEMPIDVVLADLFMPEMNGISLAQIIRRTNASMPIILLSGYEQGPEIEMEIRRGTITALIEKPISVEKLHDTLEQARRPQDPPHEG